MVNVCVYLHFREKSRTLTVNGGRREWIMSLTWGLVPIKLIYKHQNAKFINFYLWWCREENSSNLEVSSVIVSVHKPKSLFEPHINVSMLIQWCHEHLNHLFRLPDTTQKIFRRWSVTWKHKLKKMPMIWRPTWLSWSCKLWCLRCAYHER